MARVSRERRPRRPREQIAERTAAVPGLRFVSFGVDPEHDTPEVLAEYGRKLGADPARWAFLHGERPVIRALIKDGFKLAIEDGAPDSVEPILHSTRFVLVDGEGTIRGYYDGMEQATSVTRLEAFMYQARENASRNGRGT